MLASVNWRLTFESPKISMRPVLPRLITAFELGPVTIELPDIIVEPETAGCPFTVTWPVTVISAVIVPAGAASATIEYTVQTATNVVTVIILRMLLLPSI
jgi:hypothetical protein